MRASFRFGASSAALLLALASLFGAAVGAELLFEPPAIPDVAGEPPLLGPITEVGRTGWDCAPEKAATAKTWKAGGLPDANR